MSFSSKYKKIEISNNNQAPISNAKLNHADAQKHCWRMLCEVNQSIDLSCADIIEIKGVNAGAHIALLARQFPALDFEFSNPTNCNNALRVFWSCDKEKSLIDKNVINSCDILIISHEAEDAREVIDICEGFARIAAKRDIGNGFSISIFGKGLSRDIFKPKVRGQIAA